MRFRRIFVPALLAMLSLSLQTEIPIPYSSATTETISRDSDYTPIKWAIVVLGKFDYYRHPPGTNAIQKVEHWVQSQGVPYDIIPENNVQAPTDIQTGGKYSLQYANGTTRYGVFVIIMNRYDNVSAVNPDFIYWAVGNGTNAVVFGTALKSVPMLLGVSHENVSYFTDYGINQINCSIKKTFSDGITEYQQGSNQTLDGSYYFHANISSTEGKTVWYTMHSSTGKNWIGMVNTTYGFGKTFWSTVIPSHDKFFRYGTFSTYWETRNLKFVAHAINFMFKQVRKVDVGLQGYKKWKGAVTYRLDQDSNVGISKPTEEALEAGWYVDVVISPLGYKTYGEDLSDGIPEGYSGASSDGVKHGTWTNIVNSTEPLRVVSRDFIVYNTTVNGYYNRVKVDWNQNMNYADDQAFEIWENMTSGITGLMGTYYWGYIDDWENPTRCRLGWWSPLRERISDFSWWKKMGQQGLIRYGFHSWQHQDLGYSNETTGHYVYWNGSHFSMNQSWIVQKFSEAKNELIFCLGSTGYGFEADEALISHAGNEYNTEVDTALFTLNWVSLTYGDIGKNEPGWFLYKAKKPAMTSGGGRETPQMAWSFEALKDAVRTLFPIFGIYKHAGGSYNLTFNVYPPDTAYTDMFRFAHLDESFEFWSNSRYMWTNTINAFYKNNKIVLEYKANSTLKDYVWKFPIIHNGKYFNGFSDNRTLGKLKHIDGKYVYIEFSEGGNERIESTYGANPHIYQTSSYVENITQSYTPKNLTLQLWNTSGIIAVKINCTRLGQPNSITINGAPLNFAYDSVTNFCTFNVSSNKVITVGILWEHAPPNPPTLASPASADRFDPNTSLRFTWEFSDPDQNDSQFAYRFQFSENYDFSYILSDTRKVVSSYEETTLALPIMVASYYWRVKTWDNRDAEGEWSATRSIIVDRFEVTSKHVTNNRTNVGASVSIHFSVIREYDNTLFEGTEGIVYVNGSTAEWDDVNKSWRIEAEQNTIGEWKYEVSGITDLKHHVTAISDLVGMQLVIWDRLVVTITPNAEIVTVGTQVNFVVTAVYAYSDENVPKFNVNVLRNGTHFATNNFTDTCNTEGINHYIIENITEMNYDLSSFTSNSLTVTWIPKTFSQLLVDWLTYSALIVISILMLVVVSAYLLIRERMKHKNTRSLQKSEMVQKG